MLKPLEPIDTSVFCDMRLEECEGSNAPYVCPDATNSCTIATVPPGYAVYKVEDVQHYQMETNAVSLSWFVVMTMLVLISFFKGKAVREYFSEEPIHWSYLAVKGLLWVNALIIAWSIVVSLK